METWEIWADRLRELGPNVVFAALTLVGATSPPRSSAPWSGGC